MDARDELKNAGQSSLNQILCAYHFAVMELYSFSAVAKECKNYVDLMSVANLQ